VKLNWPEDWPGLEGVPDLASQNISLDSVGLEDIQELPFPQPLKGPTRLHTVLTDMIKREVS
jgi:hypothetical protein